jgi:L-alanine-DL-glutamate epimerase-like enolase superfamily enzyme
LSVPTTPGLGVTINMKNLEKYTIRKEVFGHG